MPWPEREALVALELRVQDALDAAYSGEHAGLHVLGYGEISAVEALETQAGAFACKRLPPFTSRTSLDRYRACLSEYLDGLAGRSLAVAPTASCSPPCPTACTLPSSRPRWCRT